MCVDKMVLKLLKHIDQWIARFDEQLSELREQSESARKVDAIARRDDLNILYSRISRQLKPKMSGLSEKMDNLSKDHTEDFDSLFDKLSQEIKKVRESHQDDLEHLYPVVGKKYADTWAGFNTKIENMVKGVECNKKRGR